MKTQFDPSLTTHDSEHRTWILGLAFVGIVMVMGLSVVPFASQKNNQQAAKPEQALTAQDAGPPEHGQPSLLPTEETKEEVQAPKSLPPAQPVAEVEDHVPGLVQGPALSEIFPIPGTTGQEPDLTIDALVKEADEEPSKDPEIVPLPFPLPSEDKPTTEANRPTILEKPEIATLPTDAETEKEDNATPPQPSLPAPELPEPPALTLLPLVPTVPFTPVPVAKIQANEEPLPPVEETQPEVASPAPAPPPSPVAPDVREKPEQPAPPRVTIELPKPKPDSYFNNSLVQKYRIKNPTDEISNRSLTKQMGDYYKRTGTFLKYADKFPDWAQQYNQIQNEE